MKNCESVLPKRSDFLDNTGWSARRGPGFVVLSVRGTVVSNDEFDTIIRKGQGGKSG